MVSHLFGQEKHTEMKFMIFRIVNSFQQMNQTQV